jgi:hypothetical protein
MSDTRMANIRKRKKLSKLFVQNLLIIWGVILVLNQVILFHACFKIHCIIAAIPHTFIIALVINWIIQTKDEK